MKCLKIQSVQGCRLLPLASAVLLLGACATTPTVSPSVQYHCSQGAQLNVMFNHKYVSVVRGGRGGTHYMQKKFIGASVTLVDGTLLELPAQKVASGFMVSNGQYTLRGKGSEAKWAVVGAAEEECLALK
jgi:membrane-bound inhibitor of C-type lysozyme